MPDQSGKLAPAEKKQAIEWINARWKVRTPCPICAVHQWSLGDYLVQTPSYGLEPFGATNPAFPHASVVCGNCGYTLLFNAVQIGLVTQFNASSASLDQLASGQLNALGQPAPMQTRSG